MFYLFISNPFGSYFFLLSSCSGYGSRDMLNRSRKNGFLICYRSQGKSSEHFTTKLGVCYMLLFSSVQFSCSVVSDSLRPHESQHARPPCPSPTPGVHSDSRPSSQWCQPAISSSVVPFSSCPQSLPASESFPMSQLFAWGSQSTGVSALSSFLPKNTQDWSLEWIGWIYLQSNGLPRVFSNTTRYLLLY